MWVRIWTRTRAKSPTGNPPVSVSALLPDPGAESSLTGPAPSRTGAAAYSARLADLLARCSQGHEEAFAELYDLTSSRIYGIVLKVLSSADHAAEVSQEVYVEVWRQSARHALEEDSVIGWMATMAHRRAVDRVRSVTSEAARGEQNDATGTDLGIDYVWEDVQQELDAERVHKGLASLTTVEREALTLSYLGGYTQSQVAHRLNLPSGTVKARLRDGLIGLRDALRANT